MPLYEYECKKCHHRFEKIQTFSAKHVKKCPECGGPIEQLISAPSVQFKGSGWYVTDYAKKPAEDRRPAQTEILERHWKRFRKERVEGRRNIEERREIQIRRQAQVRKKENRE